MSDTMVKQAKSLGTWGIHAVSMPADSAHSMSSRNFVTLWAISPRSAPIITPRRISVDPFGCQLAHFVDKDVQRCAGRKHRGRTGFQNLGNIALRYRPADDDR